MDKKEDRKTAAVPTDAEVAAEAERLELSWARPAARSRSAAPGQILQSLAHGRSHMVALEIKRAPRRRRGGTS